MHVYKYKYLVASDAVLAASGVGLVDHPVIAVVGAVVLYLLPDSLIHVVGPVIELDKAVLVR